MRQLLPWVAGALWLTVLLAVCWLLLDVARTARSSLALIVVAYLAAWGLFFFLVRIDRRDRAKRFVTVTIAILACLAVLEATALVGLIDYRLVFGTRLSQWYHPHNRVDPELIHIHKPNLRMRGKLRGGSLVRDFAAQPTTFIEYDIQYDSNGFRRLDRGPADCVVIGDSFVEGPEMTDQQLMTSRLADELGRTVANLGQVQYGPQQELHVLRTYGLPLSPKTCIWVFFDGNDLTDALKYEAAKTNWDEFVRRRASPSHRSFLKNLLGLTSRLGDRNEWSPLRSGLLEPEGGNSVRLWFGYPGVKLTKEVREALTFVRSSLAEAHRLCRERGIDLIVVFVPTKFRVYEHLCRFEPGAHPAAWSSNELPGLLREMVADISPEIGFVELTKPFRAAGARGSILYFPDDTHWTAEGHRLAAEVVAAFVREREGQE